MEQLALACIGAIVYGILQTPRLRSLRKEGYKPKRRGPACSLPRPQGAGNQRRQRNPPQPDGPRMPDLEKPDVRQASCQPIAARVFKAEGWDGEVDELLEEISPNAEADRVVKQLARHVETAIQKVIPSAEVMGFASGSIVKEGGACASAVPDVDLTVSIDPEIIMSRLQGRLSKGRCPTHMLDKRKVQKSAIRAFTDHLVSNGGLKFRRSAFRGLEPKVTMMAPPSLGISECSIPLDFTVNSLLPLCNATLLTECGQIDRRAKALIILVRRWAKDRGICHAAKGPLPPYAWSLLAIYFLQVREGGAILPPLEGFKVASKLRKVLAEF